MSDGLSEQLRSLRVDDGLGQSASADVCFDLRRVAGRPSAGRGALLRIRPLPPATRGTYDARQMKALVKSRAEPGLWRADVPVPQPGINDVLIRVHKTGICGTDLHIYEWGVWAR